MQHPDAGRNPQPAIEQHQRIDRLEAVRDHRVVALGPTVFVERPEHPQAQALGGALAEAEVDRTSGPADRLARPRPTTQEGGGHLVTLGRQSLDHLLGQIGCIDVVAVLQLQHLDLARHGRRPNHNRNALRA
ncbi:hypothetical protein D3C75_899330 [compost metagenome]